MLLRISSGAASQHSGDVRIGLAGAIWADDRGKVRIAKVHDMVVLVRFEVCKCVSVRSLRNMSMCLLNNSRRISFPIVLVWLCAVNAMCCMEDGRFPSRSCLTRNRRAER